MALGTALEDDDVVMLLKHDAESYGKHLDPGSLCPTRTARRRDAPKPNTRFLRHLVLEADTHNTALKRREEAGARARGKGARRVDHRDKRRGLEDFDAVNAKRARSEQMENKWTKALRDMGSTHENSRRSRDNQVFLPRAKGDQITACLSSQKRDAHQLHPGNDRSKIKKSRCQRASSEKRANHQAKHTSSSQDFSMPRRGAFPPDAHSSRDHANAATSHLSDSDLLEDVLGPQPPSNVFSRGRGSHRSATSICNSFRPDYDAKADVSLDKDKLGDWDVALEALRERARWRSQGTARSRAARFTDADAQKRSTSNMGEKDVENVVWRKTGEDREWDRGKITNDKGDVELQTEWRKT